MKTKKDIYVKDNYDGDCINGADFSKDRNFVPQCDGYLQLIKRFKKR